MRASAHDVRVDAYCSLSHYVPHLLPIWRALDPLARGTWYGNGRVMRRLAEVEGSARLGRPSARQGNLTLVAGFVDLQACRGLPLVLVEHGAGQAYNSYDPSYSGGEKREAVKLFVVPSERVAERNRLRYPSTACAIAAPRVEALTKHVALSRDGGSAPDGRPVVAFSWHWPADRVSPAASWALPHYEAALPDLVRWLNDAGIAVIGHGHPRATHHFTRLWERLGVEWVPDFTDVVRRASLYCVDTSSTAWEAAACGIPVVLLRAPWYPSADSELWPRFTHDAAGQVGEEVSDPTDVVPAVLRALADPPELRARREAAVAAVYPVIEGSASLVAQAITDLTAPR